MSLVAKEGGGESGFTPVPPGMHLARCYRIVDLGTQKSEWQGEVKHLHKVMLQFEVHGEDDSGKPLVTKKGEPMTISKNYTLSLGEKAALRKDLQTWRGKDFTSDELRGFELKNILGHWAMLSVAKSIGGNGKEYTNIMTVNPVLASVRKAGMPEPFNDTGLFYIDNPDMEMFETFGKNLQEKIQSSPEWQARSKHAAKPKGGSGFDDLDSDVPF
jgi:hypothetical protein